MNQVVKSALLNSSITALYIVGIALFMNWGEKVKIGQDNNFLAPIAFLLLFVFSASFTSFFVFGKPALMFLDGKKKEAISLVTYTLVFLFAYTILVLTILITTSSGLF